MSRRTTTRFVPARIALSLRRATRYDVVLAVIPVALAFGILIGTATAVPTSLAVAAASLIGVFAVVDALFINPPKGPTHGGPSA